MMDKQQMISDILVWAPANADRQILESMTENTLKQVHAEAWEVCKREQEEKILEDRAKLAATQAMAQLAKQEVIELRRPQIEQQQRESEQADRKTFAAAAKKLRFNQCDANYSVIKQTLGAGFTLQNIEDNYLRLGVGIELMPATASELQQWFREDVEERNSYLVNADPTTLRTEAKNEATENRQTAQLTAFERELIAGLTRDAHLPPLPQNWDEKRLNKEFIRRADRETLKIIIKRFGASRLTARLHEITKVGNFKLY